MSFSRINKLLTIALTTGSASVNFCLRVFSFIAYKIQLVSASAVTDLDSSRDGPLSPNISPSPIFPSNKPPGLYILTFPE